MQHDWNQPVDYIELRDVEANSAVYHEVEWRRRVARLKQSVNRRFARDKLTRRTDRCVSLLVTTRRVNFGAWGLNTTRAPKSTLTRDRRLVRNRVFDAAKESQKFTSALDGVC